MWLGVSVVGFCLLLKSSAWYGYATYSTGLCICSPADRLVGCFYFQAVINVAAVHTL